MSLHTTMRRRRSANFGTVRARASQPIGDRDCRKEPLTSISTSWDKIFAWNFTSMVYSLDVLSSGFVELHTRDPLILPLARFAQIPEAYACRSDGLDCRCSFKPSDSTFRSLLRITFQPTHHGYMRLANRHCTSWLLDDCNENEFEANQ